MATFNPVKKGTTRTTNYEGALAFKLPAAMELYTLACTSVLRPKFYVPEAACDIERLQELIKAVPHEFTARLAVYAREKMHLRTVPLVLAAELARVHSGDALVRRVVRRVIQRADELAEILAYFAQAEGRKAGAAGASTKTLNKLPKQLKLGVADAFATFDEYQLAKYDRESEVRLRDVMFLTHPKPRDEAQAALFKRLAAQELATPYTWETELSAKGNKAETWEPLIDSGKVGYMALLRNLRNILEAKVSPAHLEAVCARIGSAEEVAKSRQLPFRFWSAYREIADGLQDTVVDPFARGPVLDALERGIQASAANIAIGEGERVVVACDISGSMSNALSPRSKVELVDVGLVLGLLLASSPGRKVVFGTFATDWKTIAVPPGRFSILAECDRLRDGVGGSTNGHLAIEWASEKAIEADRFMFFTDCQLWDSSHGAELGFFTRTPYGHKSLNASWANYIKKFPGARLQIFDLAGYGAIPISPLRKDVTFIAGWSDKVFEVLAAIERGGAALGEIEKIEL